MAKKRATKAKESEAAPAAAPVDESASASTTSASSSAPAKTRTYPRVKVRATQDGYADHIYRRAGDVFTIDGTPKQKPADAAAKKEQEDAHLPAVFSKKWMELVDTRTPERTASASEVARKRHEEAAAEKAAAKASDQATGAANPIGE